MSDKVFRILLLEDNAADVYLFRKALENAELNFELTLIEDGAEALTFVLGEGKYAGRQVPDLAVLDLNVPKNEGTEVLAAIRRTADFSHVPVVVTSSSPAPTDRMGREQLLGERYIQKPLDLEEFLRIGAALKEILVKNSSPTSPGSK